MALVRAEMLTTAQLYEASLADGFNDDPAQRKIVNHLTKLQTALNVQIKFQSRYRKRFSKWFGIRFSRSDPKGLYIWGGVGRGKTHLMDLFFESLVVPKQRLHFHRFMAKVHRALTKEKGVQDPLQSVAADFAAQAKVICFDEFFVSDIGDAMILGELLRALFSRGVVLVATSNVSPEDLYKNGLQRNRFLPTIALLQDFTEVLKIGGNRDYRLDSLRRATIYEVCETAEYRVFDKLVGLSDVEYEQNKVLNINERPIETLYSRIDGEGIVAFHFDEICGGPRNTNDYVEIATIFHTVVIIGLPRLTESHENQARRFVGLIDEFYDRAVKVLFVAEVNLEELYNGSLVEKEFERTRSRIVEMQSEKYLSRPHRP